MDILARSVSMNKGHTFLERAGSSPAAGCAHNLLQRYRAPDSEQSDWERPLAEKHWDSTEIASN